VIAAGIAGRARVRLRSRRAAGVQGRHRLPAVPGGDDERRASSRAEDEAARHTALTNLFSGRPARGISTA